MSATAWLEELGKYTAINGRGELTVSYETSGRVELVVLEVAIGDVSLCLANDDEAARRYGWANYVSLGSRATVRGELIEWKTRAYESFQPQDDEGESDSDEEFRGCKESTKIYCVSDIRGIQIHEFYEMNFDVLDNE